VTAMIILRHHFTNVDKDLNYVKAKLKKYSFERVTLYVMVN